MSYEILYDRLFIKTGLGITPLIKSGSSNCTEFVNGRERREQEWGPFRGFVGVTGETIVAECASMANGYDGFRGEHWKSSSSGKFVDDAGLLTWAKSGVQRACTIEEVVAANRGSFSLDCQVIIYYSYQITGTSSNWEHEMRQTVKTTEQFDSWVTSAKQFIENYNAQDGEVKGNAYLSIRCWPENFTHPQYIPDKSGKFFVNLQPYGYLTNYEGLIEEYPGVWSCNRENWAKDIAEAQAYDYEEALRLQNAIRLYRRNGKPTAPKLVKATEQIGSGSLRQYVVFFIDHGLVRFISKVSSRRMWLTSETKYARMYTSESTAKATVARLSARQWNSGAKNFAYAELGADGQLIMKEEKSA